MDTLSAKIANGIHFKSAWPRTLKEWRTDPRSSQPSPTNPATATANIASARLRRHPTAPSPKGMPTSGERVGEVSLTFHPGSALSPVIELVLPESDWLSPLFEFMKTPV
jgi:hypothetical protein